MAVAPRPPSAAQWLAGGVAPALGTRRELLREDWPSRVKNFTVNVRPGFAPLRTTSPSFSAPSPPRGRPAAVRKTTVTNFCLLAAIVST